MELFDKVEGWSMVRGLDKADPRNQYLKVVEEVGEIASGLARNKKELIKDGIGDTFVTLIILAQQLGVTPEECLLMAWNEIKDRNGLLVDGIFIKEEDFTEAQRWEFAEKAKKINAINVAGSL